MRDRTCTVLILFAIVACIICVYAKGQTETQTEQQKEPEVAAVKDLVINTQEQCREGVVTVYKGEELLYAVVGRVKIVNDGKNGETIGIIVYMDGDQE